MKIIKVCTPVRGFLNELFDFENDSIKFIYEKNKVYETNSKLKSVISSILSTRFFDHTGFIRRLKVKNENEDMCFSYNKFLKTEKPYIIYLENPLALIQYSTKRHKSFFSKIKIKRYLNDENLKAIVCLSKACKDTLDKFYDVPKTVLVDQVYPFVYSTKAIKREKKLKKSQDAVLNCLFISSQFELKGGLDILETFERLKKNGYKNIFLSIITKVSTLEPKILNRINMLENVKLHDFCFSKDELADFYREAHILLNPTRQDSLPLVVLEAIKCGCVIISSDLYAINEMLLEGYNGYKLSPKYRFWNHDNLPNDYVWNNRNKTIYSNYIDKNIVEELYDKIIYLDKNRQKLEEFSQNSYSIANESEFSSGYIQNKWLEIYKKF